MTLIVEEDLRLDSDTDEQQAPKPEAPKAGKPDVEPKRSPPKLVLVSISDAIGQLQDAWANPIKATSTGLAPLDDLLQGGLRPGDFVAVVGAAGGGKSALVGQIALDAAKAGAVVMYASIEMPATEIVSRWLAHEVFDALNDDGRPMDGEPTGDLGYGAILYGQNINVGRLDAARGELRDVSERVFVQQVVPGSTVDDLTTLVKAAREKVKADREKVKAAHDPDTPFTEDPDAPFVLVVDPLQRFYASESGKRVGSALNAVNADETERIGAVAQELKVMCDREKIAVIVTSDTTKRAAGSYQSSSQSLRGSYEFNHLATLVLGLHSKATPEKLEAYLGEKGEGAGEVPDMTADDFKRAMPTKWRSTPAKGLGARTVLVECSKNRRGAPQDFALGAVLGAAWFGCTGEDVFGRSPPKAKEPKAIAPKAKSKSIEGVG